MKPDTSTSRGRSGSRVLSVGALLTVVAIAIAIDAARPLALRRARRDVVAADVVHSAPRSARTAVWFCGGGIVRLVGKTRAAPARLRVTATNPESAPAHAKISWIIGETAPVVVEATIPAFGEREFRLEDAVPEVVTRAAAATTTSTAGSAAGAGSEAGAVSGSERLGVAAVAEFDRGAVVVDHRVETAVGASTAPCSTAPSIRAYVLTGSTALGSTTALTLLNPFPGDAVFDVRFFTDRGTTKPIAVRGITVRSGTVRLLDLGDIVRRRGVVDSEILTRTGRIIVDQTNIISSGSGRGVVLTAAITAPARELAIAGGSTANGRRETLELVNSGTAAASVTIDIVPSTPASLDAPPEVVPVQVDVAAGTRASVDLGAAGAPASGGYSLVIGASSPIVAGRRAVVRIAGATSLRPALSPALSSGSTEWIAATADALTIFNLSSGATTAQVETLDGTTITELPVGPGQSLEFVPLTRQTLRVVADVPILVTRRIVSTGSTPGWSLPVAVATAEGLE